MVLSEYLFHFLLGKWRDKCSRMVHMIHGGEPLEITKTPVNGLIKVLNLNLEGNIIPAQKSSLVLPKTNNIKLHMFHNKPINLLNTLLASRIILEPDIIHFTFYGGFGLF